jgi:hypothetical protein
MPLTPDNLDRHLADLTAAPERTGDLWRKALDRSADSPLQTGAFRRLFIRPTPSAALAAGLILIVSALLVSLTLPSLSGARNSTRRPPVTGELEQRLSPITGSRPLQRGGPGQSGRSYPASEAAADAAAVAKPSATGEIMAWTPSGPTQQIPASNTELLDRAVIRKATIELITDDVRAAFAKAAHLPSDASGEYVQDSSLTGEGKATQAQLTLRVTVAHLSSTLDALRALGTVRSENSGGEDVTAQVVDLDARIRNEQRVETELLQLLEKRADAPLKDILELRASLDNVRQSIESLIGQRERLGRLVDLATILVIIRPPAEEPAKPAAAPSLGDYFKANVATSWRHGLEFLTDTLANLLALLLGGLVWWLLLTGMVYAILRHRRAALAKGV